MQGRCPSCAVALDPSGRSASCHRCRGLWVAADEVASMIAEMQGTAVPGEVPFAAAPLPLGEARRDCPACGQPMTYGRLEGIAVDRCDPHGYWFDADELGEVLARSRREPPAPPPRRGLLERLRDLVPVGR